VDALAEQSGTPRAPAIRPGFAETMPWQDFRRDYSRGRLEAPCYRVAGR